MLRQGMYMRYDLKYRPDDWKYVIGNVEEIEKIRALTEEIVSTGKPTTFCFVGRSGVGKTTVAQIIADKVFKTELQRNSNYIYFNCAEHSSADDVKTKIIGHLKKSPKRAPYIMLVLDEFDQIQTKTQEKLRIVIEKANEHLVVICANHAKSLAEAIVSRFGMYEFKPVTSDMARAVEHIETISKVEGITYEYGDKDKAFYVESDGKLSKITYDESLKVEHVSFNPIIEMLLLVKKGDMRAVMKELEKWAALRRPIKMRDVANPLDDKALAILISLRKKQRTQAMQLLNKSFKEDRDNPREMLFMLWHQSETYVATLKDKNTGKPRLDDKRKPKTMPLFNDRQRSAISKAIMKADYWIAAGADPHVVLGGILSIIDEVVTNVK